PAVVEALDDLGDRGARADRAQPVVVRVHDPPRIAAVDRFGDELAIAWLEDVQRHLLGGQEDDAEREEADLVHRRERTRPATGRPPHAACRTLSRAVRANGRAAGDGAAWTGSCHIVTSGTSACAAPAAAGR